MHYTIPNTQQEVLFITSYPPRKCGIATYSKDLIHAIHRKFKAPFSIRVCALEEGSQTRTYPQEVKYSLQTSDPLAYIELARKINEDEAVKKVFVQHEFGLFGGDYGEYLLRLLYSLEKPVSVTFHTVLPSPDSKRQTVVQSIAKACDNIVVMTKSSSALLQEEYNLSPKKISVIPHGTHMVLWKNKQQLKRAYQLEDRLILSTFGLLSPNKSIETALEALPLLMDRFPNILYFVLGRTHPGVIQNEGEVYRKFLEDRVKELGLSDHVHFVNRYLELEELLEYLRLTDIYLFTSKDPHQAVSGTFAYAMSSACPIISTPIPHAVEMLHNNTGVIVDFRKPEQLAEAAKRLLTKRELREQMGRNAFHQTRATVWENTAISHAHLFNSYLSVRDTDKTGNTTTLNYSLPEIHLEHIYALTNNVGIIQFSHISNPDLGSGYTLDDNARALIALCMHYRQTRDPGALGLISTYLNFIDYCQQPNGRFLNYVDQNREFHVQNNYINLEDSNGRAIWALGVVLFHEELLPLSLIKKAGTIFNCSLSEIEQIESPRAIAFAIKGLYFYHRYSRNKLIQDKIEELANKLLEKYNAVSATNWQWFEEYLTYANSTLPEAMLYAYLATRKPSYKMIAHITFEFLLSHLFKDGTIKVVSNRGWHRKGSVPYQYGEQPIDVSYTIQALDLFYRVFKDKAYRDKMRVAFSWFLGNNHLGQIIYNPLTGGCYDGLEEHSVNLNQGAESTLCYLIARLIVERIQQLPVERDKQVANGEEIGKKPVRIKQLASLPQHALKQPDKIRILR